MTAPPEWLSARVRNLVGEPTQWTWAESGYTPAERWVVELADGSSAFVKAGVSDFTVRALRVEGRVYRELRAPFVPRTLAWEDGDRPVLVLEDLSGARWPPPWRDDDPRRVMETLGAVARTPPPAGLGRLAENTWLAGPHWPVVSRDPEPFLSLGIASREWLEAALPTLLEAEASGDLSGRTLVHLDVRSDNLCFAGDRVVLVDWSGAAVGDPVFDVAFWAPSLRLEGGPLPEGIAPGRPELAALVAGFFCAQAGLPTIPDAPRVRWIQLRQARIALPWAARVLGLAPPDLRWAVTDVERAEEDLAAGRISEDGWYAAVEEVLADAYLASDDPRGQSGKSGDEREWRWARELVLDAVPPDGGALLDVGCANGYLMESLERWAGERGLGVEPYGLEISERLASLARRRLPRWADRIFVGNAIRWTPPRRFDVVHTGVDYVPRHRRRELLERLLREAVRPGGRLVLRPERVRPGAEDPPEVLEGLGFSVAGAAEAVHPDTGDVRRTAWVRAPA